MPGATRPAAALCAALLALAPGAGRAQEAQASGDGDSNLELHAFYKTFNAALRPPPGLVKGTEALQVLRDEARVEHPDEAFPEGEALPQYGASSAHTLRAWGRLLLKHRVEISAGWQLDATIASDPALTGALGLGGAIPVTGTQTASRRLVDFDPQLAGGGRFLLQQNLDLLAVKVALPRGEIVVGRQVLSWGTGRLWNPTDLLSPFAPTDVDREVRHGVDAVRYSLPLSKTSLLDVLWLPQKQGWAQGGVVRGQANFKGFDVSLSAAKYVSDVVFGADTTGDIGPLGVHVEAGYTLGLSNLDGGGRVEVAEQFLRGVAGLEWRPAERWTVGAEYYFNGFGAGDPSGYAAKLRSPRVTSGEVFGAGRHYLGLTAVRKATQLLTLQATILGNLADPSALAVPMVEYWASQRVLVRAGAYLPLGRGPAAGPLQGLTLADVVGMSPPFVEATSTLGLRSEYGASPAGLFAQLGVYF